jgi:sulfatase maturation enzyme AslB (radical SAM superfamily)
MSGTVLLSCLDWALARAGPRLRVIFSGGEPLLAFRRMQEAVRYVDRIRPAGTRIDFRLLTNGLLLSDPVWDFLAEHSIDTQVSWDGVARAQAYRKAGTQRLLQEQLVNLRQRHPRFFAQRVTIALTLLPETVPLLALSVSYLISLGIAHLTVAPVLTHHDNWCSGDLSILEREFAKVFDILKDHFARTGQIPLLLFRRWDVDLDRWRPRVDIPQCSAPTLRAPAFDPAGQLWGCGIFAGLSSAPENEREQLVREAMRVGCSDEGEFAARLAGFGQALLAMPLFTAKEKKYSTYGRCADCSYLHRCTVCPWAFVRRGGVDDPYRVPDFLCAFNLVTRKYRAQFPPITPALPAGAS